MPADPSRDQRRGVAPDDDTMTIGGRARLCGRAIAEGPALDVHLQGARDLWGGPDFQTPVA